MSDYCNEYVLRTWNIYLARFFPLQNGRETLWSPLTASITERCRRWRRLKIFRELLIRLCLTSEVWQKPSRDKLEENIFMGIDIVLEWGQKQPPCLQVFFRLSKCNISYNQRMNSGHLFIISLFVFYFLALYFLFVLHFLALYFISLSRMAVSLCGCQINVQTGWRLLF